MACNIAFVGCGVISKHHLDAIAALDRGVVTVTAVIEPNAERLAACADAVEKALGARPAEFASLAVAAAADPDKAIFDSVDVMVPSLGPLHETIGVEALKLGYHVHMEKPVSNSVASAERLVAAQAEGLVLMVAENSQYWREVVEAQRLIAEGAIGEVLTARAKFWESGHPKLNDWAAQGSYDKGSYICEGTEGFVFDGGLHWLRPLRMLMGEVTHVVSTSGPSIPHMSGPGQTQALLKFASGKSAIFESILAPGAISDQPFFQVQGTAGEIVIDGFEGGARMYTVTVHASRFSSAVSAVAPALTLLFWFPGRRHGVH